MKHSTLFLSAALLWAANTTLSAQTIGAHGETIDAHGVITAAPADATYTEYTRTGYTLIWDQNDALLYQTPQFGTLMVAACEDGTMFFQNLVSETQYDTWVVGKMTDDVLTIEAGQKLWYDPEYHSTVRLQNLEMIIAIGSIEDSESSTITYRHEVLENGRETLTLQSPDGYYGNLIIYSVGAVWDDDNTIAAVGDFGTVLVNDANYVPSEDDLAIEIPESVKMGKCSIHGWSYRDYHYVDFEGTMGSDGEHIYIQGIYSFLPEGIVKGQIVGNEVIFPQHQFLGLDGRLQPIYVVAVSTGVDADGDEFTQPEDNWKLTIEPGTGALQGGSGDQEGETYIRFSELPVYEYGVSYDSMDEIRIVPLESNAIRAIELQPSFKAAFDLFGRRLSKHDQHGLHIEDGRVVSE